MAVVAVTIQRPLCGGESIKYGGSMRFAATP